MVGEDEDKEQGNQTRRDYLIFLSSVRDQGLLDPNEREIISQSTRCQGGHTVGVGSVLSTG